MGKVHTSGIRSERVGINSGLSSRVGHDAADISAGTLAIRLMQPKGRVKDSTIIQLGRDKA